MSCNRSLLILSMLVLTTPVLGQQHKPAAGRPAAAGGHPGQGRPGQQQHMMNPQQQMEAEFFQHQMMLMEMMAPRRGGRGNTQGKSTASQNQATGNVRTHSGQLNQARQAKNGSNAQQTNQSNGKNSKQNAAALKETQREKARANAKAHETKASSAKRSTRAADNGTISLLKTEHSRLHRADADYAGHRVKAMNHIATAIRHLGSTSGINGGLEGANGTGLGGGHMPQAESDQILHNAIFQLRQTQGSLGNGSSSAAHHQNAHASINEAIHELEVALRIR
jgi:hypothetical protein